MRLLVIGGSGYIGTQLIDYIKEIYENIKIVVVDSENYSNCVNKRKDVNYVNAKYQDLPVSFYEEFTDIVLLGGQGSVSNSNNVINVIDNNVRNFAWLLEVMTQEQKLIYASSSSVYGRTNNKEVDEEFSKTSGYEPYNYYDWSKQTIDQLAELSGKQYYALRFGTVNGFSRNLRNDVMINSMIFNAKKNGKIFVSNHYVNRPILGIDDLCKAVLTIINEGKMELSGVYNLNSFNATVYEIASKISSMCNVKCEDMTRGEGIKIVNFKLQTKSYDFKINSNKFIENFGFKFNDTLKSIIESLLNKWELVQNYQNRLDDSFVSYKMIDECRICSNKTKSLLNLGYQPLANNYTKYSEKLDYNPFHLNIEEKFPLHLHYCDNCFHTQLNCIVKPEKLFNNYLYVSGTSNTLKKYFEEFAVSTMFYHYERINKENISEIKILDIACNDGSQLDAFHNLLDLESNIKITTVGVDPADNIYRDISSQKSYHDIYCEFFSESTVNKLKEKYGEFDIIIAQNVFAHIDYPGDFLKYTKELMNDNSCLYIQTSQKNMIIENQFDTAYHEHLSFFNTNSMNILCKKNKLILSNVHEHEIHGKSYVFQITKLPHKNINTNIEKVIQQECLGGLYSNDTYKLYNLRCLQYKNNFSNKVIDYKLEGKQIIAFGSTAKSMTVFNFCGLNNEYIDFMIDESVLKQNLFTPGSNIIVCPISNLKDISRECVIIITAWNFYYEIKNKIKDKLKEYNIKCSVTLLNINSLEEDVIN
jgi:nucleoside-diphosphate-sugar epimerase/2-polyprenyl-3-methyl-5-hydroxy-6-metoxy-1,4-benzoquinol methylase